MELKAHGISLLFFGLSTMLALLNPYTGSRIGDSVGLLLLKFLQDTISLQTHTISGSKDLSFPTFTVCLKPFLKDCFRDVIDVFTVTRLHNLAY